MTNSYGMAEIPDCLKLLFETSIDEDNDRYVVSVPSELVENGSLSTDTEYRIALLATENRPQSKATTSDIARPSDPSSDSRESTGADAGDAGTPLEDPPVDVGDVRTVTIDTLGDQGDGIAKVERGFVVIVPGTEPGDRVDVEITEVKDSVAFADPVDEAVV